MNKDLNNQDHHPRAFCEDDSLLDSKGLCTNTNMHAYLFIRTFVRGHTVVDIACGDGYGAAILAEVAAEVIGVDHDPRTVERARRRNKRSNLSFANGEGTALPLGDSSVDAVVGCTSFADIDRHPERMREWKRVLRPKGVLVLFNPDTLEAGDVSLGEESLHKSLSQLHAFEVLLKHYFNHIALSSHRVVHGSCLIREGRLSLINNFIERETLACPSEGALCSRFIFALASDVELPEPSDGMPNRSIISREPADTWVRQNVIRDRQLGVAAAASWHGPISADSQALDTNAVRRAPTTDNRGFPEDPELRGRISKDIQMLCQQVGALSTAMAGHGVRGEILASSIGNLHRSLDALISDRRRRNIEMKWFGLPFTLGYFLLLSAFHPKRMTRSVADALLIRKHHAFDEKFYLHHYPEFAISGSHPLWHFCFYDAGAGRKPNPLFNAEWYLTMNPDAASHGSNLLVHYLRFGVREGRWANPLFHTRWYLASNPDVDRAHADPLIHYLRFGAAERRDPHPLFDTSYYLEKNPDVNREHVNPLAHFLEYGASEGRDPHPLFSLAWYLSRYPDVARSGKNALAHYVHEGWKEDRRPMLLFDGARYVREHPECVAENVDPLSHRLEHLKQFKDEIFFPSTPIESQETPHNPEILRLISFYLPQYHPIPENNTWWGEGFTEWTNVRRGQPQFPGHRQPLAPHPDVGYYDLRNPEVLPRQAALARKFGIHGFCYYYYWFGGKRLLDFPIDRMLQTGQPNFPFCLCWANENWTRRWDGMDHEILIAQEHTWENDRGLIRDVMPFFRDPRYIRIDGKPLFIVYRPLLLPDPVATMARWRAECRAADIGNIFLAGIMGFGFNEPAPAGLDAMIEFPPHDSHVWPLKPEQFHPEPDFAGTAFDYRQARQHMLCFNPADPVSFKGVMPGWDNTARRGERATVFLNSSPGAYYNWLKEAIGMTARSQRGDKRLVFINAWNEWGEGCHLEPDSYDGYAWLNATRQAILDTSPEVATLSTIDTLAGSPSLSPEKPDTLLLPPILFCNPLPARPSVVISVLFFHREDLIEPFLRDLAPALRKAEMKGAADCRLVLTLNYPAAPAVGRRALAIWEDCGRGLSMNLREPGYNAGFSGGHNSVALSAGSDVFILMNNDIRIPSDDWIIRLIEAFQAAPVGVVGPKATVSKLRADACGIPVEEGERGDYLDGSLLAIRTEVITAFGLFSEAYPYFYLEDSDLFLRYRQAGVQWSTVDIPHEHFRQSSTRLVPRYTIQRVLGHNRASFFSRWGNYLASGALPNILRLDFDTLDKRIQCAALPTLFGALSDHPAATIDVVGVHAQLADLFFHDRLRLVSKKDASHPASYHRSWRIGHDVESTELPLALSIAKSMSIRPDFVMAEKHLRLLAKVPAAPAAGSQPQLVLFAGRKPPLADGLEPASEQWAESCHALGTAAAIEVVTELAEYERSGFTNHNGVRLPVRMISTTTARDLLEVLARSSGLITGDNWVLQLAQLLNLPAWVWWGATLPTRRIWNWKGAMSFCAQLECLGCAHRWGQDGRNFCLRAGEPCLRADEGSVQESLSGWISGQTQPTTAQIMDMARELSLDSFTTPSSELDLSAWPATQARSVLVLIPVKPTLPPSLREHAEGLAAKAIADIPGSRVIIDSSGDAPPRGAAHPYRQDALARIRQGMIDRYLRDESWVFWVDVDIVHYDSDLIVQLIERAEGGIAAPLVLMDGNLGDPGGNTDGFGPGRFYDIAGFVEEGRWARFTQPYFNQPGPVFNLDSVGCCYLVAADLYRHGARHEIDPASAYFVNKELRWTSQVIAMNQRGPVANAYTEHYSLCQFALRHGLPVRAFADLVVRHMRE